jgi:hypothetical protein
MPLFANPQARILTPFFLLTLLFGVPVGLHLEVSLHIAIAWSGAYVLGRTLGMRRPAAIGCATVFAGSSWFTTRVAAGELVMMACVYFPWLVAFAWQRRTLAAAAALALISCEGGPYPSSYAALLLCLVLLSRAVLEKSKRPLYEWTAICTLALALAAVHIVPAYHLLTEHPRLGSLDFGTVGGLLTDLFPRNQDITQATGLGRGWGFQEMAGYVGPVFGLMALIGIMCRLKCSLPWMFMGAVMVALSLGARGPYWPWPLIHYLPVFRSERLPYRFVIPLVLTIAVLAGFGFDVLCETHSRAIALAIIILGGVDCLLVSAWQLGDALQTPVHAQIADSVFTQLTDLQLDHGPSRAMLRWTEQNRGVVNCYEYTDWRSPVKGVQDSGYQGEQYLLGLGVVRLARWSPNKLSFAIDTPKRPN